VKLTDPFQDGDNDPTGDKAIAASGCGLLACIILFSMFVFIFWRAMQ
jgi:hypothetical protein